MALLKERKAKATSKLARARKALESAEKELADVAAAERVMADITGESTDSRPSEVGVSGRDIAIAKLIPTDPTTAMSPAELYPFYVSESGDDINLDAFRTAVWRLQKKTIRGTEKSWIVKADSGRYWREALFSLDDDDGEDENAPPY